MGSTLVKKDCFFVLEFWKNLEKFRYTSELYDNLTATFRLSVKAGTRNSWENIALSACYAAKR